jgi:hypothetical protein
MAAAKPPLPQCSSYQALGSTPQFLSPPLFLSEDYQCGQAAATGAINDDAHAERSEEYVDLSDEEMEAETAASGLDTLAPAASGRRSRSQPRVEGPKAANEHFGRGGQRGKAPAAEPLSGSIKSSRGGKPLVTKLTKAKTQRDVASPAEMEPVVTGNDEIDDEFAQIQLGTLPTQTLQ